MKEQLHLASAESRWVVRPPQPGDCGRMAALTGQFGYECTGKRYWKDLARGRTRSAAAAYDWLIGDWEATGTLRT